MTVEPVEPVYQSPRPKKHERNLIIVTHHPVRTRRKAYVVVGHDQKRSAMIKGQAGGGQAATSPNKYDGAPIFKVNEAEAKRTAKKLGEHTPA